jgi:hypothetical protein
MEVSLRCRVYGVACIHCPFLVSADQVPKDLLDAVLNGGDIRIVGNQGREAILCTDHKSYAMKKAETSNCGKTALF